MKEVYWHYQPGKKIKGLLESLLNIVFVLSKITVFSFPIRKSYLHVIKNYYFVTFKAEENRPGAIDLFTLYVLFPHFRSCDVTLEEVFFHILSRQRAYACRIHEKQMRTSCGLNGENKACKQKGLYWAIYYKRRM